VHLKRLLKVRKVGISFHGLSQGLTQLSFDYSPIKHKQENLSKIIDELNSKLGQDIIRQGLLSKQSKSEEFIAFGYILLRTTQKFIQQLQIQKSCFQSCPQKACIPQRIDQPYTSIIEL
jgi:molybdopterin/thiamine biosynthesis adenylyltransferase